MKRHVQEALDAELSRLPRDYDHLRLTNGKLVTPDGGLPVKKKKIGYGLFSDVYRVSGMPEYVLAVSSKNVPDKAIIEEAKAKSPKNPYIPDVVTLGQRRRLRDAVLQRAARSEEK